MPNTDKPRNQDSCKYSLESPGNPEDSQDLSKSLPQIQNPINHTNAFVDGLHLFRPNKRFRRIHPPPLSI